VTTPTRQRRLKLVRAGGQWDAIRVPVWVGHQVIALLAAACGCVVSDGTHMWFFVEPGEGWELVMPGVTVLDEPSRADVLIPADPIKSLPGPHWTRTAFRNNTSTNRLRAALAAVIS
jgi:hypothetical protein